MLIERLHPRADDLAGFIPSFLSDGAGPAKEQFNANYSHGGGWCPLKGWKMIGEQIKYPGDPILPPIMRITLESKEVVLIYPYAWVAIRQPNGDFEIGRMD